jgi:hypothetical protein
LARPTGRIGRPAQARAERRPALPATGHMAKPAGSFTVALGEELKKRFVAAAHAAGAPPAVLARRAIAEALRDGARQDRAPAVPARPGEPFNEIRVKVPRSAAARLAAAAGAAGMTRSAYVSAATIELAERSAARAAAGPMPGIEAAGALREALVKSNAILAPIGRNLNQVARSLNTYPGQMSSAERQNLAEVAHRVSEHLELASELLNAIRAPRIRLVR